MIEYQINFTAPLFVSLTIEAEEGLTAEQILDKLKEAQIKGLTYSKPEDTISDTWDDILPENVTIYLPNGDEA